MQQRECADPTKQKGKAILIQNLIALPLFVFKLYGPAQPQNRQIDFAVYRVSRARIRQRKCRLSGDWNDDKRRSAGAGAIGRGGKIDSAGDMCGAIIGRGNLHIIGAPKKGGNLIRNQIIAGLQRYMGSVSGYNISRWISYIRK